MYHKIKNTLVGLSVAMSIVGLSYSIGHPPVRPTASIEVRTPDPTAQAGSLGGERIRSHGIKSQLSMPFFSFAPLLPRRES